MSEKEKDRKKMKGRGEMGTNKWTDLRQKTPVRIGGNKEKWRYTRIGIQEAFPVAVPTSNCRMDDSVYPFHRGRSP